MDSHTGRDYDGAAAQAKAEAALTMGKLDELSHSLAFHWFLEQCVFKLGNRELDKLTSLHTGKEAREIAAYTHAVLNEVVDFLEDERRRCKSIIDMFKDA